MSYRIDGQNGDLIIDNFGVGMSDYHVNKLKDVHMERRTEIFNVIEST